MSKHGALPLLQKVKLLQMSKEDRMQLLLVPLDDSILFPGMTVTIAADVGDAEQVFLLPRPDGEYATIVTIADVVETGRLPGGINSSTLTGVQRGRAGTASPAANGDL